MSLGQLSSAADGDADLIIHGHSGIITSTRCNQRHHNKPRRAPMLDVRCAGNHHIVGVPKHTRPILDKTVTRCFAMQGDKGVSAALLVDEN